MARPTGRVTLLFSDIEGSTVRWERNREAMAIALARHDRLMRDALQEHRAYIFKTMGDAFCAAFDSATDAVAAALVAQRALAAEDFSVVRGIRVRMALHAGETTERGGDYFGPVVNRVARLLAIGHGAQVIISGTCAELIDGAMPSGCSLRDLGAHRLKDLDEPERVYQLVASGLQQDFPALRSLEHLSNNLPAPVTPLVGREDAVADIGSLLDNDRLVTIVGAGGAGKTRCALAAGAGLVDRIPDGVWLAEFAPLVDPALVTGVVARLFGIAEAPNRPLLEQLLSYLKRKHLVLVLDNCEHVVDAARQLAASVLGAAPAVRILATSREPFSLAGERVYRIPSLSLPAAMQLFAQRAGAVDRRFEMTDANARQVEEICRRLDGIPLAIELAAARVKTLSPQRLMEMLDKRFRILTGGDRNALPRHQTMRALIDWSYDLLGPQERALFRKLSAFAGGFTLEDVTAAFGDETTDEVAILDLLSSLADKSLLVSETPERYGMLESTREYARERLAEAGEEAAASRAHALAFLALLQGFDAEWERTPDRAWRERGEPEIENIRAALAWSLGKRADVPLGQRLACAFVTMWGGFGEGEGSRWVEAAQASVDEQTPGALVARLDLARARLATGLAQSGLEAARRALPQFQAIGDTLHAGHAKRIVGYGLASKGRVSDGVQLLEETLRTATSMGAHRLAILALSGLASARDAVGDAWGARQLYSQAVELSERIGAERQAVGMQSNLAEAVFRCGEVDLAAELAEQACATYRALNLPTCKALVNLAAYSIELGRYDQACTAAREALTTAVDLQYTVVAAFALQHLATIAAIDAVERVDRSMRVRGARLFGYVDARVKALDSPRDYTEQQQYDRALGVLRCALGDDELERCLEEGRGWSEESAIAEAMLV